MYIDKLDNFFDKMIDDFYASVIIINKLLTKIIKEPNFVKYQADINEILKQYILSINQNDLNSISANYTVHQHIKEVIKKYTCMYIFIYIGLCLSTSDNLYINNIIEFTRNQPEFSYKIANFFNSESNSLVINSYIICKQINEIINIDNEQKKNAFLKRKEYEQTNKIITMLGNDIMKSLIKNDKNNIRFHNIIKIILLLEVYKKIDKKILFETIESLETNTGEFIFIDVVMSTSRTVNYQMIENLMSKDNRTKGFATMFWDFIVEQETNKILNKLDSTDNDTKILYLINSGILIPIVDDLLLFHKDNEKYDKHTEQTKKKKEDTRIRYIVNKVYTATGLNSSNNLEAKQLIYTPLYYKKAILVNDFEDNKIISKFMNVKNLTSENIELMRELENYMIYPYVNLQETDMSINITPINTIETIRAVSLNLDKDYRQYKNAYIQTRITNNNQPIQILGFVLNNKYKNINCIRVSDLVDIRTISNEKNGYKLVLENLFKTHEKYLYWLFDTKIDKIHLETYEQQNKFSTHDEIKHILGKLYDDITKICFDRIINYFSNKKITFQYADSFIKYYCDNRIRLSPKLLNKFNELLIIKIIKNEKIEYDITDDIVNGMTSNVIILPEYKQQTNNKIKIYTLDASKLSEQGLYEEKEEVIGICQHNINWDRITELKRTNPTKFIDELYEFIQQYSTINVEQEFVCKSCGFYLNIRKFVTDGTYDNSVQKWIPTGMTLDTPLEDIPEYEKYRGSIRNLDKFIERIAMITGIGYYLGAGQTPKSRRKLVVKDAIDIILENNAVLKKTKESRSNKLYELYNINKNMTHLYTFELENNIFVFSSKEKDYYKTIKRNNILAYLIILIILDLNDTQILIMNNDKKSLCNFQLFEKVYSSLFENMKFKKNNIGETMLVKNYVLYCYVLYILSCYCIKYNLWDYDYKGETSKDKKQKLVPMIQKKIIATVIDITNSILENKDLYKNRIFTILSSKFYDKLNNLYSNKEYYIRLKEQETESNTMNIKKSLDSKHDIIKLEKTKKIYDTPKWRNCRFARYTPIYIYRKLTNISILTNLTNCMDGKFHIWKLNKNSFICNLCNQQISDTQQNIFDIQENYKLRQLDSLSEKYCRIDGDLHEFVNDDKTHEYVCTKCKYSKINKYNKEQLNELSKARNNKISELALMSIKYTNDKQQILNEHDNYYFKLKEKIINDYNTSITKDNKYKYIDNLISELETIPYDELKKIDISLKDNIYIINHDHLGNLLDKPIILSDKDNKIQYKQNHTTFNTDVLYYTSYKNGKVEVFYDVTTKRLIGYKEESKNYTFNKKYNRTIEINYSIYNKIKMLGYRNSVIDKNDYKREIVNEYSENIKNIDLYIKENNLNTEKLIIPYIFRERYENLKNVIYKFLRVINRIANNFVEQKYKTKKTFNKRDEEELYKVEEDEEKNKEKYFQEDEQYFSNIYDELILKYSKKINNVKFTNNNNSHQVFKHWKGIKDITMSQTDSIQINNNNNNINYEILNEIDINNNLILFYLVSEFTHLIKYNDGITKINIGLLIIEFINTYFYLTNEDNIKINLEYKRFNAVINSYTYIDRIRDKIGEEKEEDTEKDEDIDEMDEEIGIDIDREDIEEDGDILNYLKMYDKNTDLLNDTELEELVTELRNI